jgi:hypothetical protein
MEDTLYKILWIDDEHEELSGIKGRARRNGLLLIPFKSLNGGLTELEKNYTLYDGVLLDAKCFENEDDSSGSEDTEFSIQAKDRIIQIPKKFELFVLTGQAEAYEDKTYGKVFSKLYKKGVDEDIQRLFDDLKSAAQKLDDTQVKHKYQALLAVCEESYLGSNQFERLFALLKHLENFEPIRNTEDKLNPLRKVIEVMFSRLGDIGLIPENILNSNGWINGSSLFLSNKHSDYEFTQEVVPAIICENIHRLLNVTHDVSHGSGNLRLKVDEYLKNVSNDYLYRSCIFLLFDILIWFKDFIDSHPNVRENKGLYRLKEQPGTISDSNGWIKGEVYEINSSGWGKFLSECGRIELNVPDFLIKPKKSANGLYCRNTNKTGKQ